MSEALALDILGAWLLWVGCLAVPPALILLAAFWGDDDE